MALQTAIRANNLEEIRRLATPETISAPFRDVLDYYTPLSYAINRGSPLETIETLIELGADVNYSDNNTRSPLDTATRVRSPVPVLIALLRAGANPNGVFPHEPLSMATHRENFPAMLLLWAYGGRMDREALERLPAVHVYPRVIPFLAELFRQRPFTPDMERFVTEQVAAGRIHPEDEELLRAELARVREAAAMRRRGPALSAWATAQAPPSRRARARRSRKATRRGGRRRRT